MKKCGCVGLRVNNDSIIEYCPVHEAAPLMLAALKSLVEFTVGIPGDPQGGLPRACEETGSWREDIEEVKAARAAIAAARGEV